MSWRRLPRAPAPGAEVCAADALPDRGTLGVEIDGFPLLLVRLEAGLFCYFNACPHQGLPLDWRGGGVLGTQGAVLRCSNHGAGFDAATGQGCEGLGVGCALIAVPVVLRGDRVIVEGD